MTIDERTGRALEAEADALVSGFAAVPEVSFDAPTRCPPWTVRELLAHLLVACDRLPEMLAAPAPSEGAADALAYFRADRRFSDESNAARIAAAQRDATQFAGGQEIVAAIAEAVRRMVAMSEQERPGRLVRTRWDDAMVLDDFLRTRVVELAVHGLDLAAALGRPSWLSAEAGALTEHVLGGSAATDVRTALGWDRVRFIETMTGRRRTTPEEAAALDRLTLPTMG